MVVVVILLLCLVFSASNLCSAEDTPYFSHSNQGASEHINHSPYQDDIIWSDDSNHRTSGLHTEVRPTGYLNPERYWPNLGRGIPYAFEAQTAGDHQWRINKALDFIENRTQGCITFKPRDNETSYIYFITSRREGCRAEIGRFNNTSTRVYLQSDAGTTGCMTMGIIIHEILHALGLFHEQSRPDRDEHVQILSEHIHPHALQNFDILPSMSTWGTQYDFDSVLHYRRNEFSLSENQPVIVPKNGQPVRMGQRETLSNLDVAKLQNAYKCWVPVESSLPLSPLRLTASVIAESTSLSDIVLSNDTMMKTQCLKQFTAHCKNPNYRYSRANCEQFKGLGIGCSAGVTQAELQQLVLEMALPPLRALGVHMRDGPLLSGEMFQAVRAQVVDLRIRMCHTARVTGKLRSLLFSNLLDLSIAQPDTISLIIKKHDFDHTPKLRIIDIFDIDIETIENNAFSALRELKIITLDHTLATDRLHCSCEFTWYRQWLAELPFLFEEKPARSIYSVAESWGNNEYWLADIYRTVDCRKPGAPLPDPMYQYTINEVTCK